MEYPISGTPCEKVLKGERDTYESNVQEVFPDFQFLKELNVHGYVGTAMLDSDGNALGVIAVLHSASMPNLDMAESMLKIFAVRASAELERLKVDGELRRYEQIVSSTNDLMAFVNDHYTYLAVNKSYLDFFHKNKSDMIGKTAKEILGDKYFRERVKDRFDLCLTGIPINFQEIIKLQEKGERFLDINYNPYYEKDGTITGVVATIRDITSIQKMSRKLDYQATHDELTGLINRREFEERLSHILEKIQHDNSEHALCYMDLDQFKIINDSCGHVAGDELLRQLGEILLEHVRKHDTIARLGGDEFAVLIEHCCLEKAQRIAANIKKSIENFRFFWQGKNFQIGVSIGLVSVKDISGSLTEIMKQADIACYQAKDQGRNRIHVYSPGDTDLEKRRGEMQWVGRINRALEEERFVLYYQDIVPIVNEHNKRLHREILIRMAEDDNIISPDAFLPAAERYGLITNIDQWVVGNTLNWIGKNEASSNEMVTYSINVSGVSIVNEDFLQYIIDCLACNKISSGKVCFEITETAAISNLSKAMKFIKILKNHGCLFALDDFGSGLSSFAYLKNLPVDYLKIDGLFIKDIVNDPIAYSMVKSVNELGHLMGKQTVAEWVEDKAIKAKLFDIGIDYAQGYIEGKPTLLSHLNQTKYLRVI